MSRTRASAKAAGTRFETLVAKYLAETVDDRIERRAKTGAQDRGDIVGVRHSGQRVVIECKDTCRINLAGWAAEAGAYYALPAGGVSMGADTITAQQPVVAMIFGQSGLMAGASIAGTKYTRIIPSTF